MNLQVLPWRKKKVKGVKSRPGESIWLNKFVSCRLELVKLKSCFTSTLPVIEQMHIF